MVGLDWGVGIRLYRSSSGEKTDCQQYDHDGDEPSIEQYLTSNPPDPNGRLFLIFHSCSVSNDTVHHGLAGVSDDIGSIRAEILGNVFVTHNVLSL